MSEITNENPPTTLDWAQKQLHADSLSNFVQANWWCLGVGAVTFAACLLFKVKREVKVISTLSTTAAAFAIQLLRFQAEEQTRNEPLPTPPREPLLKTELKSLVFDQDEKWRSKEDRDRRLTRFRDERISTFAARSPGKQGFDKARVLVEAINAMLQVDRPSKQMMRDFSEALKNFLIEERLERVGDAGEEKTAQQKIDDQQLAWAIERGWFDPRDPKPKDDGNCLFESVSLASQQQLPTLRRDVVTAMRVAVARDSNLRRAIETALEELHKLPTSQRRGIGDSLRKGLLRDDFETWVEKEGAQTYLDSLQQPGSWGGGLELAYIAIVANINIVLVEPTQEGPFTEWSPAAVDEPDETIYLLYQRGYHHYLPLRKPQPPPIPPELPEGAFHAKN